MHHGPKLLITRRWPEAVEAELRQRFALHFEQDDRPLTTAELRQAMLDHDIICPTVSDRLDATILSVPGRRVKLIAKRRR